MSDEIDHVQYTGAQINAWLDESLADQGTLLSCFRHTHQETWHDLANMSNYLADHYALMNTKSAEATALASALVAAPLLAHVMPVPIVIPLLAVLDFVASALRGIHLNKEIARDEI